MKIFYHPVHTTLEYDELECFTNLGHEVFSTGAFLDSNSPRISLIEPRYAHTRPTPTNYISNQRLVDLFIKLNPSHQPYTRCSVTADFLKNFDMIYINHNVDLLLECVKLLGDTKLIVFNTLSQSTPQFESIFTKIRNYIKIVRFSDGEGCITGFAGADAIIHPGVDEQVYSNWIGTEERVLMVSRAMPSRPMHTNKFISDIMSKILPLDLYGTGNDSVPYSKGQVEYTKLPELYKDYRVFLNLNTKPGCFTYTFVEALMTGCPIVSVGPSLGSYGDGLTGQTFIGHKYIQQGKSGYWSDNLQDLIKYSRDILSDYDMAKEFSKNSRQIALENFTKKAAEKKWKDFLSLFK